jgi:hypothetical protein
MTAHPRRKLQLASYLALTLGVTASIAFVSGCGSSSSSSTEDSSTSGSAAAAIGGSVNGSSSSGTMALNLSSHQTMESILAWANPFQLAYASTSCPTFSGSTTTLTYSDCSFSGSSAVWNGSVAYTVASPNVTREVTTGTTRTASSGTVVTINTTGSGMTPFTASGASAVSGGTTATLSGSSVTGVAINGVNFVAASSSGSTLFNHLLTTSSADGGVALTKSGSQWSGTVVTFHQLVKVIATSTLTNLTFSSGCCLPTGGSISTSFNTTYASSTFISKYNGQTETLTFTGCGTATYSGPESTATSVTLNHCL